MTNKNINTALKHLVYDDYLQAESILKQIIKESPYEYKAFYYLGWIYEKINKKALSNDYFSHAYFLNNNFFDIDEKIHGYESGYSNHNLNLLNIIKWMIKTGKEKEIPFILASLNNETTQRLIHDQMSIRQARQTLYNNEIKSLVRPYVNTETMLIFDIGFNLNLWGLIHPWNFPVAFSYLSTVSKAILSPEEFEKNIQNKNDYNFIELELIKKRGIIAVVPNLINILSKTPDNVESIIETLGFLQDYDAIFPLLNFLRTCSFEHVYSTVLALSRIGEENITPVVKKYIKKYLNTDLQPLLFVTLCRLKEGKPGLLRLCESVDINIREEAVNQLSDYKGKDVVKALLKALYDSDKTGDFYPVRNTAYVKLEEMDISYLSSIDRSFSKPENFRKVEDEIFIKDNPKIEWIEKILKKL